MLVVEILTRLTAFRLIRRKVLPNPIKVLSGGAREISQGLILPEQATTPRFDNPDRILRLKYPFVFSLHLLLGNYIKNERRNKRGCARDY